MFCGIVHISAWQEINEHVDSLMEDVIVMQPAKQPSLYSSLLVGILLLSLVCSSALFASPRSMRRGHHQHHQTTLISHSAKRGQLQHQRANLQHKISGVQQKLSQVKKQERQTTTQLRQVEQKLRIARGQLQYAVMRFERSKVDLHRATLALRDAKSDYADAQDNARKRLVALYERGGKGYMDMLVSSNDYGDMLRRSQLAQYMMRQDREALLELKQRKDEVAHVQQSVQLKTAEVASWKEQVAQIHERTAQHRQVVAQQLTSVRGEAAGLASELDALQRDSAALASMLKRMQTSSAGKRRFNTVYTGHLGGGFLPVHGRISSPFGWRMHPISHVMRLHTGVDIAAPTGTPILVTGGGEVIFAGWRGGYGNAVIVDHGHGRATLYGHMSAILVSAGQVVARGQVIGRVGMTGAATGPHVHYELRINGVPVPPL